MSKPGRCQVNEHLIRGCVEKRKNRNLEKKINSLMQSVTDCWYLNVVVSLAYKFRRSLYLTAIIF